MFIYKKNIDILKILFLIISLLSLVGCSSKLNHIKKSYYNKYNSPIYPEITVVMKTSFDSPKGSLIYIINQHRFKRIIHNLKNSGLFKKIYMSSSIKNASTFYVMEIYPSIGLFSHPAKAGRYAAKGLSDDERLKYNKEINNIARMANINDGAAWINLLSIGIIKMPIYLDYNLNINLMIKKRYGYYGINSYRYSKVGRIPFSINLKEKDFANDSDDITDALVSYFLKDLEKKNPF